MSQFFEQMRAMNPGFNFLTMPNPPPESDEDKDENN
jgi:hypothetical protein